MIRNTFFICATSLAMLFTLFILQACNSTVRIPPVPPDRTPPSVTLRMVGADMAAAYTIPRLTGDFFISFLEADIQWRDARPITLIAQAQDRESGIRQVTLELDFDVDCGGILVADSHFGRLVPEPAGFLPLGPTAPINGIASTSFRLIDLSALCAGNLPRKLDGTLTVSAVNTSGIASLPTVYNVVFRPYPFRR